jgi:hypothetical protein
VGAEHSLIAFEFLSIEINKCACRERCTQL